MQEKVQKYKHSKTVSKVDDFQVGQLAQKQIYSKPRMVSYGPLAKNIALGALSGAEADSTFAV